MYERLRASATRVLLGLVCCAVASAAPAAAQVERGKVSIAAASREQLRVWGERVDGLIRDGELRVRQLTRDTLVAGRTHERSDQYFHGVRVFGGDVARQLQSGQVVSVFGTLYDGISIDTSPAVDEDGAATLMAERGLDVDPAHRPELVVLPLDAGSYALAWRVRAMAGLDVRQYFLDAQTGAVLLDYSDRKTQSAVGRAAGVLGDTKKISASSMSGRFIASDALRPPSMRTYDMQGNPNRVVDVLDGRTNLTDSDVASDSDNDWTDGAVDDAHIYAGYTYDFYFKRFNRRGLNNADIAVRSLVHPARRNDVTTQFNQFPDFFVNAFYWGDGIMVYGVGLPPGRTFGGQTWDFLSGALDVVAHELTHGVTEYTSNLIYRNESGALNEAFSDMMGTAAEFFFQPAGSGPLRADYLLGEDVVRPGGLRSMEDPAAYGDPDHYSKRFLGSGDNGGVHINSGIPNHVFYLAIEGGTNRTSGLGVQGVGGSNREQIEKVFYRAFTALLPANSTFSTARAATIQAARDLYGANSAAERALTQAWTAVGVN